MTLHAACHRRLHTVGRRPLHHTRYSQAANTNFVSTPALHAGLTLSRSAGGVYVPDHDGVFRFARDNEAPFVNLRRGENVLARMSVTSSQDLTTAGWTKGATVTVARDASVLTDSGNSSNLITASDGTSSSIIYCATIASAGADRRSWVASARLKAGSLTSVILRISDGAFAVVVDKTVTLTSQWTTFSALIDPYVSANGNLRVSLRITSAGTFYVDYMQMEEVTGASVKVFGGYVDVATQYGAGIAAVKYFATANGNTYNSTSGVVTEAAGSALTTGRMLVEGQATNLIAAANYRNISTWTSTGVSMKATTPTGIDGTTLTASQNEVMEDIGATEHRKAITFTAATAAKQSATVYVKRGTGTRHVQVRLNNATDLDYASATYNLDTLALIGAATADYTTAYTVGGYVCIEIVKANVTTGTQNLYVNLHNGTSNSYTGDGISTLVVDWAQVVTDSTAQSPVVGAATRYTSFFSRPWIGAANNFWVYVDFYFLYSAQALTVASLYPLAVRKDASNYMIARFVSGGTGTLRVATGNAGVNQEADIANFSIDRGDRCRMVVSYDEVNGLRCRASNNGAAAQTSVIATSKDAIASLASGAKFHLGNLDAATTTTVNRSHYLDYRVGTGILTVVQQQGLVGV